MAGASAGCEHEPNWSELFPMVARPDDSAERKARASAELRQEKPTCQKLLMNPTACYGCPSNPIKENPEESSEAYRMYSHTISTVARLVDACKLGLISGGDITPLEFTMMRMFYTATESRRLL